jgi:hypothetical protein
MSMYFVSIAQLLDATGEGIAEFRVEISVTGVLEDLGTSYSYSQCGFDEEGRKLYVSPWLNLKNALQEVERISCELKLHERAFTISSSMRSRVVDILQE